MRNHLRNRDFLLLFKDKVLPFLERWIKYSKESGTSTKKRHLYKQLKIKYLQKIYLEIKQPKFSFSLKYQVHKIGLLF